MSSKRKAPVSRGFFLCFGVSRLEEFCFDLLDRGFLELVCFHDLRRFAGLLGALCGSDLLVERDGNDGAFVLGEIELRHV